MLLSWCKKEPQAGQPPALWRGVPHKRKSSDQLLVTAVVMRLSSASVAGDVPRRLAGSWLCGRRSGVVFRSLGPNLSKNEPSAMTSQRRDNVSCS